MTGLEDAHWLHGVSARVGGHVVYRGLAGVITGSVDGWLLVKLDGYDDEAIIHPKAVSYLDDIEVPA